ncbi:Uncharacterized protein Fot_56001 [Forsythia ovata]|uniref:Uncharacterized protein n=1 Tax=Forsythia ovata TaxID=205694 RepID=A0ABD1P455_9LAMI
MASHEKCTPFPEHVIHFPHLPEEAICMRHQHKVPATSIDETFFHLPLLTSSTTASLKPKTAKTPPPSMPNFHHQPSSQSQKQPKLHLIVGRSLTTTIPKVWSLYIESQVRIHNQNHAPDRFHIRIRVEAHLNLCWNGLEFSAWNDALNAEHRKGNELLSSESPCSRVNENLPLFAWLQTPAYSNFLYFATLKFCTHSLFLITISFSQLKARFEPTIRILLHKWFHIRIRVQAQQN